MNKQIIYWYRKYVPEVFQKLFKIIKPKWFDYFKLDYLSRKNIDFSGHGETEAVKNFLNYDSKQINYYVDIGASDGVSSSSTLEFAKDHKWSGLSIEYDENKFLNNYDSIKFENLQGSTWAPTIVHKDIWNSVKGFSEEFFPGSGSDPDFNMKLWKIGVRLFKGLANSRVYHFSSISLRKKAWNNGAKTFLLKWGISIKFFKRFYLKTDTIFDGELSEPSKNLNFLVGFVKCKILYLYYKTLSLGLK